MVSGGATKRLVTTVVLGTLTNDMWYVLERGAWERC